MEIHGTCKPGFAAVRDAFAANFAEGLELGAAAAVTVDGEFVVDVWAGDADTGGAPWQRDTIVNVYSTTKTMAATCMMVRLRHGLGFGLQIGTMLETGPDQMFWGGRGGSLALIDLDARMSVAYVPNRMGADMAGDSRGFNVVEAARTCM